MSAPEFSLDRNYSEENNIDSQGRKWMIHSSKSHPGLVWGRPEPDREDAQIPKQFSGKWTSKDRLQKQINVYLTADWNKAEAAMAQAARVAQAAKENKVVEPEPEPEPVVRKTEAESLAELPQEIRDVLGDTIATEEPEAKATPVVKKVKTKVAKKKA